MATDPLVELALAAVESLEPGALLARALVGVSAEPTTVLSLGKAAVPMAKAATRCLGNAITECVVAGPDWGAHPLPDDSSVDAANALLAAAGRASRARTRVFALVSGGGSALAALPAGGMTLADKRATIDALFAAGAPIEAINTVRKHVSGIKGGRLAARAAPSTVTTFLVSDVVGGDSSMVASGPTLADPSTYGDALACVEGLPVPAAVRAHLEAGVRGELEETPTDVVGAVHCLADNRALVLAAAGRASNPVVVREPLVGDVSVVAADLVARAGALERGALLVAGGEPTIALAGTPGRGGRAHHLALLLSLAIAGRSMRALVLASDGVDGNSGGAGAVVDGTTADAIAAIGIDARLAIDRCDSRTPLAAVGASLPERATGNNLADLVLVSVL